MYNESGYLSSIKHFLSPTNGYIESILHKNLNLDFQKVNELLRLRSIYINNNRATPQQKIKSGDYIRAHTNPKRYPENNFNWNKLVLFQNENFIAINKPGRLPVHPTLDNGIENLISYLELYLQTKLFITHRLDQETNGIILITKNQNYQRKLNEYFKESLVKKIYSTFVKEPIQSPLKLIHYMKKDKKSPKKVSILQDESFSLRCELHIIECNKIKSDKHKIKIELITGRTHQIRSQLAAINNPILGDKIYGDSSIDSQFKLTCEEVSFLDEGSVFHFKL